MKSWREVDGRKTIASTGDDEVVEEEMFEREIVVELFEKEIVEELLEILYDC